MAKLDKSDMKKAAKLAQLLDEYVAVTDAVRRLDLKKFEFSINVSNENDDSDFLNVPLSREFAKAALAWQQEKVKAALAKLGVQVG